MASGKMRHQAMSCVTILIAAAQDFDFSQALTWNPDGEPATRFVLDSDNLMHMYAYVCQPRLC